MATMRSLTMLSLMAACSTAPTCELAPLGAQPTDTPAPGTARVRFLLRVIGLRVMGCARDEVPLTAHEHCLASIVFPGNADAAMTTTLTDDLFSQLQGQPMARMSQHLGMPQSQAAAAISTALPLLLGALGRNASQPQGAEALFGALQKDHAGLDIGSVLGSVLGGNGQGAQILGHIFGAREQTAAQGLGTATGLGGERAATLLKLLAPIVMAYLAKRMSQPAGAAATAIPASPQALGETLGQEQRHISQQGGVGGGLLGAVLDRDGDGDVDFTDLVGLGGSVLGGRRN